jgi:hypothetical protein
MYSFPLNVIIDISIITRDFRAKMISIKEESYDRPDLRFLYDRNFKPIGQNQYLTTYSDNFLYPIMSNIISLIDIDDPIGTAGRLQDGGNFINMSTHLVMGPDIPVVLTGGEEDRVILSMTGCMQEFAVSIWFKIQSVFQNHPYAYNMDSTGGAITLEACSEDTLVIKVHRNR